MFQSIAKIIQRDFFPDIEKLHAQNEFLEATENKNLTKLMEIARKYSGSRPPTEPCEYIFEIVKFSHNWNVGIF